MASSTHGERERRRQQRTDLLILVLPTALYIYLARDLFTSIVLIVLGLGIRYTQNRHEIPERYRNLLPFVQPIACWLFLGGSAVAILGMGLALLLAQLERDRLVGLLQPWWRVQQRVPLLWRRVAAYMVPFGLGALLALLGPGREWTVTFLSVFFGTTLSFLIVFNPPEGLRRVPQAA